MNARYSSVFAPYISGLVALKRASGYLYGTGQYYLRRFDSYCSIHAKSDAFTRELVMGWAKSRDGENPGTHRTRISPVRELGTYMQSLGISDAFVLPSRLCRKLARYVPHFFTKKELILFFPVFNDSMQHYRRTRRV